MQAQDARGARLTVRARSDGLRASDVDDALNGGELVTTWVNLAVARAGAGWAFRRGHQQRRLPADRARARRGRRHLGDVRGAGCAATARPPVRHRVENVGARRSSCAPGPGRGALGCRRRRTSYDHFATLQPFRKVGRWCNRQPCWPASMHFAQPANRSDRNAGVVSPDAGADPGRRAAPDGDAAHPGRRRGGVAAPSRARRGAVSSPFLEPGQLGSRRFAVRPIPGPRFLGIVLLSTIAAAVLGLSVLDGGVSGAVGGAVGLLIVHGAVIGSGLIEQHRVHDRGLQLGPTFAGTTPFVIPWSTVDPSSLQVHRRANLVGGRYGPNGLSSNLRMAAYSTSAVSVTGLLPQLASPRRRIKAAGPARHHVHGPLGRGAAAGGADHAMGDGGARPQAAGPGGRGGTGRRRAPRRAGRRRPRARPPRARAAPESAALTHTALAGRRRLGAPASRLPGGRQRQRAHQCADQTRTDLIELVEAGRREEQGGRRTAAAVAAAVPSAAHPGPSSP